jgi:flagellar hook-length control protein FliK
METQSVSTKHIVDTLGHTAPDRRNDDFFLALLNESRRHGEANTPRSDDRDRPDPYRNKIDPDRNEFRARDRDVERAQREPARDDHEFEESRAETRLAEDRKADRPRTEPEDTAKAPAERGATPTATEEPDAAASEAGADTAEIDPEAPAEKPTESTTTQAASSETVADKSAATAPAQGASANQPIAAGVTTAGEAPRSEAAATAAQGSTILPATASDTAKAVAAVNDPTTTAAQAVAAGQSGKTGGSKQPGEANATPNTEPASQGAAAVNGNKGARPTGAHGQAATAGSGASADTQGSDTAPQARANPSNAAATQKSAANHPGALPADAGAQGSAAASTNSGTAPRFERLLGGAGKVTNAVTGTTADTAQASHTSPAGHVMQASARPAGAAAHMGAQANQPGQSVHISDVAVHIHRAVAKGHDRINIRLNPAELGHIEVRLKLGADGVTRAVVHADRPETLDLLQRDARGLERALQDAGLKTDSNSLSFSLRDHGQGGLQHGDSQASDAPQFADSDSDASTREEAPQAPPPSVSSNRALDIRV